METDKEDDWRGFAVKCLANILSKYFNFKLNSWQCNNLRYAFTSKLFKHICSTAEGHRYAEKNEGCWIMRRAWKEVYRVLKEAELYLQNCCSDLWWKKSATLSTTGEAHALHIHDLVWSVLCLDLNTLFVQNVLQDTYDAAACRKFGDFHAEMSNLTRIHDEYVDKKRLISALKQEYEQTANIVEPQNKALVAKFLAAKLQAACPIEPALIGTVPSWLHIDPQQLEISKPRSIGQGSYGAVYRGSWLGLDVAVKELPSGAYELFRTESLVLAKLHSPFIVQLIGTCVKEDSCYVVMELVHSSLDNEIEKRSKDRTCSPFPLHVAVDIMLQISRGMEYLHSQGIMHMDLKAANVLIEPSAAPEFRKEGYCRVKLCDFGMAGLKLHSFRCSFPKGTSQWRAPEAFAYPQEHIQIDTEVPREYTYKADVYSFAMTCYEILTGKQPFEGVRNRYLYRKIVQGERPILPSSHIPPRLGDFIKKCWDTDPGARPCFKGVSMFLRYMKLVIMRMDDLFCALPLSICSNFEEQEIGKYFDGNSVAFEERVTSEEEALIIKALDGDFPLFCCPLRDGSRVAVKKNTTGNFLNEAIALSQLHHPNILRLRGSDCHSKLVLDAAAVWSLDKWLFGVGDRHVLNSNIRRSIALGIARSIAYLHGDCEKAIANVALDPKTILLDECFAPKLCGFGSAVAVVTTSSTGNLQHRLDNKVKRLQSRNAYAFGILLMEILRGCRWRDVWKDDMYPPRYRGISCKSIARLYDDKGVGIRSEPMMKLLDRRLEGEVEERECKRVVYLALWCLVNDPFQRPSMNKVVAVMEGVSELTSPPPLARLIWKRFPL